MEASAIQIRLARPSAQDQQVLIVKGVLVRDPSLPERTVLVRPSMIKAPVGTSDFDGHAELGYCSEPLIVLNVFDSGEAYMGYMEMFLREACGVSVEALVDTAKSWNANVLAVARSSDATLQHSLGDSLQRCMRRLQLPVDNNWLAVQKVLLNIRDASMEGCLSNVQTAHLQRLASHIPMSHSARRQ